MSKFMRCRGQEDFLHWTLMSIAFYFSFIFYSDMLFGLLVAGLVFEIMKPTVFETGFQYKKSIKGIAFIFLGSIFIFLSLLATCSALTNNYNNIIANSKKKIETQEYKSQKQLEKSTKQEIKSLNKQLETYPTLKDFTKDVPSSHSTNLKSITNSWLEGKEKIQNKIDNANTKLSEVLKGYSSIEEYSLVDTREGYKSYTKLFDLISSKINVRADYIAIFVFILIAVLIEFSIVATKHIAVVAREKRLGIYKPTQYERLQEYQNKVLEEHFNNMFSQKTLQNGKNEYLAIDEDRIYIPQINTDNKNIDSPNSNVNPLRIDLDKSSVISLDDKRQPQEKDEKGQIKDTRFKPKILNKENIKRYFNYINQNKDADGICLGYKKVAGELDISLGEAQRIYNFLKENEVIETFDRKTKIKGVLKNV